MKPLFNFKAQHNDEILDMWKHIPKSAQSLKLRNSLAVR